MEKKNDLADEILAHGPSPGSLVLVLSHMKEQGRIDDVIRACVRFLPLYPDDVRLRALLADSYAEKGFFALAELELQEVGRMIDRLAPVYRSLAEIYQKQGRYSEAADMMRRYAAHCPEETSVLESLRSQVELAAAHREAVAEARPPEEDIGVEEEAPVDELVDFATPTIAELYYSQGRIDAAIQTYEKVIRARPDDQEAISRLGELKTLLAQAEEEQEEPPPSPPRIEERMITILERWLPRIQRLKYV